MIETVLENVTKHKEITDVYLHVHTANDDAQRFYTRFGFVLGEKVENYYRGVEPPDAFVMRKAVNAAADVD